MIRAVSPMRLTSRPTAVRPIVGPLLVLLALAPASAQQKPPPPPAPATASPTDDPEEAARAEIEAGLDRRLSVRFDATPLEEVVAFVQEVTGLNVALDPEAAVDHPVTLALEDVTLRAVLDQALAGSGVQMRVWSGALVLTRRGKDLGDPPRPGADAAGLAAASRKVTLRFPETPLTEALEFVRDVSGLEVQVDAGAQRRAEQALVRLRLRDLTLAQALTLITHLHGLTWRPDGERIVVERRRPRERPVAPPAAPAGALTKQEVEARLAAPVTLRVDDGTLFDLAAQVEARSGLRVRLENAGKDDLVSLHLEGTPLREALDLVCDVQGARWSVEEGGVLVLRVFTRCETCGEPRGNVSPCPSCGAR